MTEPTLPVSLIEWQNATNELDSIRNGVHPTQKLAADRLAERDRELQQARAERDEAVGELTAISGGDGFRCGLIYGIDKPFVGGCGKHVSFADSYRCADCTASFHRACINEHFKLDAYVKTLREQNANGAIDDWKKSVADAEKRAESAEQSLSEAREELDRKEECLIAMGESNAENFREKTEAREEIARLKEALARILWTNTWHGAYVIADLALHPVPEKPKS